MYKALFIPNSSNQLNKFLAVSKHFRSNFEYVVLNLDRFKNSSTLSLLKKKGIPHVVLQDMSEKGADDLLGELRPDIIVVGNDTEALSYLFIIAGRGRKIPSLLIQDGTLSWRKGILPMDASSVINILSMHSISFLLNRVLSKIKRTPRPYLHQYGQFADYVAVWGAFTKKCLIEHGVKGEKIIVTGSPSLDELSSHNSNHAATLRRLGADPRKKTVLYAASDMAGARLWSKSEFDDALRSVCDAVKGIENAQIILRQHPFHRSREPRYLDRFTDNERVFSGNDADMIALIAASDAVVTEVSSSAAEAVALGKSLAIINLVNRPFISDPFPGIYISSGVARPLDDKESLRSVLEEILYDDAVVRGMSDKRKEFIVEHFHRLDGLSGKRIVDLMEKLASRADGDLHA